MLVKSTQVSLYPFLTKRRGLVVQVSYKSIACFTIICQMTLRIPIGLSAAMENDAITAICRMGQKSGPQTRYHNSLKL